MRLKIGRREHPFHSLMRFSLSWIDEWGWDVGSPSGLSLYEEEGNIFIEAALPGVETKNVEVSFDQGFITIEGEKEEEKKGRKYYRKASSPFYYRVPVPPDVDESREPQATFKNDVMKIKIQKGEKKKHTIQVKEE